MKIPQKKYTYLIIILITLTFAPIFAQDQGIVQVESSPQIKKVVAQKIAYNKSAKPTARYTIQLFYGTEQGAIKVRNEFNSVFTDFKAKLKFDSPDWKVLTGSFKTRLEADRTLAEIKKEFPDATVRNPKIKK